jgi:hypothetical protein
MLGEVPSFATGGTHKQTSGFEIASIFCRRLRHGSFFARQHAQTTTLRYFHSDPGLPAGLQASSEISHRVEAPHDTNWHEAIVAGRC